MSQDILNPPSTDTSILRTPDSATENTSEIMDRKAFRVSVAVPQETASKRLEESVLKILKRTFWACTISMLPHTIVPILQSLLSTFPLSVHFFIGDVAISSNCLAILFTIVNVTQVFKAIPLYIYQLLNTECVVLTQLIEITSI